MAELVDALDLGSSVARRESSSLSFRTIHSIKLIVGATMQISIEKTEGLERNLKVTIPADKINSQVTEKLKEIGKQVQIKGFRPGRVPKNIIAQRYGQHAKQDVIGELINTTITDAIKENDIEIAETPEITEAKDLEDGGYSFVAKLELMPQIPTVDFENLEVKVKTSEVTDKDVEKMIKKLQVQKQEWKDSKGKIANGDLVTLDFVATQGKDFTFPESGKKNLVILLGESGLPKELEDKIIGMKVKESDSLKVEFPKEFSVKEIADKKVNFDFEIVSHKKGKLPKVDAEFVQSFGVDSGKEEDLVAEIKENLERELTNAVSAKKRDAILEAVRKEVNDVQISDKMIARESASLAHQAMDRARQMGIENPEHPDHKEFEKNARERILNSLIINDVVKKQNITVDYAKVRDKVKEVSQTFENPQEIMEYYYETPELMSSIENVVLESQVVDWIGSQVKLKEKKVKFDKMMETND